MALFQVQVRDYMWLDDRDATRPPKNRTVQSPRMNLLDEQEPVTVRLLQGPKRLEVIRLATASGVRDTATGHANAYMVDAHGVVLTAGPSPDLHPVWIYTEGSQDSSGHLGSDAASVVDIVTNKMVETRFSQVCWLPHRERRDGTLVTFLHEVPRKLGKLREFFVVLQVPGRPDETTAAWMAEEERQQCCRLDDERKKAKFDAQLVAFRPLRRRPTASLDLALLSGHLPSLAFAVTSSRARQPPQHGRCGRGVDIHPSLGHLAGNGAKPSLSTDARIQHHRSSAHAVPTLCCKHPELGPTASDLAPKHRHVEDAECDWGTSHNTHCVFREEAPETCVLRWHRHCPQTMQDIFGDLERDPIVEGLEFDLYRYSPEINAMSVGSSPAPSAPASFLSPLEYDGLMTDNAPESLVSFVGEGSDWQCAISVDEVPSTPAPQVWQ